MIDQIDDMAIAIFEGYRSDMRGSGLIRIADVWAGMSPLEKGHWRRAARAAYKFLDLPA